MTEFLFDILVFLICVNILIYALKIGKKEELSGFIGWRLLISGLTLLTIGSLATLLLYKPVLVSQQALFPLILTLIEQIGGNILSVILIFGGFWKILPYIGIKQRKEIHALVEQRRMAEQANQSKSDFLAHVSHELRTPLNAILGFLELMRKPGSGGKNRPVSGNHHEETQSYAAIIHDCATDLLAIINNILDLSKIEAGRFELTETVFDLRITLKSVTSLMRHRIESKPLTFTIDISPNLPPLYADERVIKQSVLNLLSNAAKFTLKGGTIRITAYFDPEEGYIIDINDNGCGMTREEIDRALTRFGQVANQSLDNQAGTGLGLPLVKDFLELHDGQLILRSEMGIGTSAIIKLPQKRAELDQKQSPGSVFKPSQEPDDSPAQRILLAEDNAANRILFKKLLEKTGHRVMAVENGTAVLKAVAEHDFDLIIMDIHMPEMDGIKATRRIRKLDGRASTIPILALTGTRLETNHQEYLSAGMNDYLEKPVDPEKLRQKVAKITMR